MTTALPSVHRASVFSNNAVGLPSYPGSHLTVSHIWTPSATDDGDGSPIPGPSLNSAPQFFLTPNPPNSGQLQPSQQLQQQQQFQVPSTYDGPHRFTRERAQASGGGTAVAVGRVPVTPIPVSSLFSPTSHSAFLPAAVTVMSGPQMGATRCFSPDQPRRKNFAAERAETVSGWPLGGAGGSGGGGGAATSAYLMAIGGGGGSCPATARPGSPPPGRMITHDAFVVNRPIVSASNAGERRRLFTGTAQELLRGSMLSVPVTMQQPPQTPTANSCTSMWGDNYTAGGSGGGAAVSRGVSLRSWTQSPWASMPGTPSACTGAAPAMSGPAGGGGGGGGGGGSGGNGGDRISRGRSRGMSGVAHNLSLSLPVAMEPPTPADSFSPRDAGPYAGLPLSASGHRSPSPRIIRLHPGGLGSAAMSIVASGHHTSRQQVIAQARGMERLLAMDVEEALARAPTPRQITTLTPGSLDGMGHPVLLAADGARILKRIPDHLPRHAAERMVATPMRPEQLSLALESTLDPDLDLDMLAHSPDGGDGSSSYDETDYLPPARGGTSRGGVGVGMLPYMTLGGEASANGGLGGGGLRPSTRAGGGGGRKAVAGADGGSPQRMTRSWSSPPRQPRGAPAPHSRTGTLDGSGGGGGLVAENSRGSRIGMDSRGGMGSKQRRRSRSPISREGPSTGGRSSPGRVSPPGAGQSGGGGGGGGGGRQQSIAGEDSGTPKWLGTYIPKEDPLGLWTGKRMSKTEVIVEKRLFAMRHNPGMRLELESRAAEALRQRAAAQAEMAAVTRAREEEALARKAQLRAEIEARRRGVSPRNELERTRSRTPRGFTKEAKAALERQLLAEAEAEPRGPLTRDEAATVIQATWKMYCQRRRFLHIRVMVIRIQRAARLRYCVIRNRRRHAAAAALLLEFLCAIGGNRHATAAMDLREIHSNYIRRRLLEKKGDLRHQTAVAVLVREWEAVEARILGLRTRSLKGSALAAMAAVGFSASVGGGTGGGGGGHHHHGPHNRASGGSGNGGSNGDKDMLTAVAGEMHSAAHGTRLLGKALEARKKGVMLLGGGKDLNKQLTVEYAVAHALATDRVTLTGREPVPNEVKALVSSCYLEHKSVSYTAFIGVVWRRRARWFGVFNQQRHMAMARSVVETGSAWRVMDTLAKEATEKMVGQLPVLPRMRTSATLRELRALMQAGVQEADIYTSYMLKGGIHELERRLHSEMLLRNSFGHLLRGGHRESRDIATPPNATNSTAVGFGGGSGGGAVPTPPPTDMNSGGGNRRPGNNSIGGPATWTSPAPRRLSVTGGSGPMGQPILTSQSSTASLSAADSPRRASRTVRIDPSAPVMVGTPPANDAFLDTVSEAGSEMTSVSNLSVTAGVTGISSGGCAGGGGGGGGGGGNAATGLARARFLSMLPSQKAGVAQLKERWWRDAVVRVDACLRKRYKLNGVSLVTSLEDPTAPNLELFSTKLAEINANPEKAEVLLTALPGSAGAAAGTVGTPLGSTGVFGGPYGKPRTSQEGTWSHRAS